MGNRKPMALRTQFHVSSTFEYAHSQHTIQWPGICGMPNEYISRNMRSFLTAPQLIDLIQ